MAYRSSLTRRRKLHLVLREDNREWAHKWIDEYRDSGCDSGLIYFVRGGKFVKIGYTTKTVEDRLSELQTGCPFKLEVLATIPGDAYLERDLHRVFGAYRTTGEWFRLSAPGLRQIIEEANTRLFV